MTAAAELHAELLSLFHDELNLEVESVDTDLFESGILDSLTFVDLLYRLETRFGVTVSLDDLEPDRFRSIARIAEFVTSARGGG